MGNAKLAGIAAEDIGKTAYGIFKAGNQYIGKTVGIIGEALTIEEMGQKLDEGSRASARSSTTRWSADVYRSWGFPGADEMGNMFQVYRDFDKEMLANRNLDDTRRSSIRSCRTSTAGWRRTRTRCRRRRSRRRQRRRRPRSSRWLASWLVGGRR